MSSVKFLIGAEADIVSGGEMRDAVEAGTSRILDSLPRDKDRGVRLRPTGSTNINPPAIGNAVITFAPHTPAPGTLWWLVEVVVTGADDRTAIAGAVAALYCGSPARQLSNAAITDVPLLGSLVRPAQALPAVFAFGGEAFPVKEGEELFVIVYSPTNAITLLSAVATVMQVNSSAVSVNRL